MKLRRKLQYIAVASSLATGAFGFVMDAQANPADFIQGPFEAKYVDHENILTAEGNNLLGIFSVSSINPDGSNVPWWVPGPAADSKSDGTELNGYFTNLILEDPFSPGSIAFSGGLMVVYNEPVGTYDDTASPNTIDPTSQLCGGSSCGTPWLTALFVPGIDPTDLTTTLDGTLSSTDPITGSGTGYLSVADLGGMTVYTNTDKSSSFVLPGSFVGTENALFDTNGFTFPVAAPADLQFGSRFFQCGYANSPGACDGNTWGVASDDPVRGSTIPEPASLWLLGLGLLGMGGTFARRKSA
jgi:hypothetical protein